MCLWLWKKLLEEILNIWVGKASKTVSYRNAWYEDIFSSVSFSSPGLQETQCLFFTIFSKNPRRFSQTHSRWQHFLLFLIFKFFVAIYIFCRAHSFYNLDQTLKPYKISTSELFVKQIKNIFNFPIKNMLKLS